MAVHAPADFRVMMKILVTLSLLLAPALAARASHEEDQWEENTARAHKQVASRVELLDATKEIRDLAEKQATTRQPALP
jgi:hypothetical protein